ncbi:MAG TPA: hypothetical protein DEP66_01605 [Acidimicrobiaceae bacterium]|nr:hypothetical protein [Acidimicrobiaceae bacterium]HCB36935.1 hypothetical protein [Acidimicrobiaceae bacterium]
MTKLDALLVLQEIDSRRTRISHTVENLPERAQLAEADADLSGVDVEQTELMSLLDDVTGRQSAVEEEVARLKARIDTDSERLYGGAITSPKDAAAMAHEIETLKQHQSAKEDAVLELMEEMEPLQSRFDDLAERQEQASGRAVDLTERIAAAVEEATAADAAAVSERAARVAEIAPGLVALYEQHRSRMSGQTAVGVLDGGICSACNLSLPTGDRDRISALDADEPVDCPECGALLVRPAGRAA